MNIKRQLCFALTMVLLLSFVVMPSAGAADAVFVDLKFDVSGGYTLTNGTLVNHPNPKYTGDKILQLSATSTANAVMTGPWLPSTEYTNINFSGKFMVNSTDAKREIMGITFLGSYPNSWTCSRRDFLIFDTDGNIKLVPNPSTPSAAITVFEGYDANVWYDIEATVGAKRDNVLSDNVKITITPAGGTAVTTYATIDCGYKYRVQYSTQFMKEGSTPVMWIDDLFVESVDTVQQGMVPTVQITAPLAGSVFSVTEPLTLSADAQAMEAGATISKVEFYEGSTKIGEATSAPYEFIWSGFTIGEHIIKATATDSTGLKGNSDPVTFNVIDGKFIDKYEYYYDEFSSYINVWKTQAFGKTIATGHTMENLETDGIKYINISSPISGTSDLSVYLADPPQGGQYTAYGRFMVDNNQLRRNVFDIIFTKVEGGSYRISDFVLFDTDGNLKGKSGSSYVNLVENYQPGVWYEIALTFENLEYTATTQNIAYEVKADGVDVSRTAHIDMARDATFKCVKISQTGADGKSGNFMIDYTGLYKHLQPIDITSPAKGAKYYTGDTVPVSFTINGIARSADVYVDDVLAGAAVADGASYTYSLEGLEPGDHAITVRAQSYAGENVVSDPILISIENGLVLPNLFCNDMILQRRQPVNVWGSGPNGETVTVSINGQSASGVVENNAWEVKLPPMEAGGPYTMTITAQSSGYTITYQNVLIGEVWVTSGQSNLAFTMRWFNQHQNATLHENVRLFTQDVIDLNDPAAETTNGKWNVCTPEVAQNYSLVSYYLAEALNDTTGVPIGIICSGVGGSPARCWMSSDVKDISDYMNTYYNSGPIGVPGRASAYYNSMIAPLHQFTISGVVWYQGAADSYSNVQYDQVLSALITDWRTKWNVNDLPFVVVQEQMYAEPDPSRMWAWVREGQQKACDSVPNTHMVALIDNGEPDNIHPGDKNTVANRVAAVIKSLKFGDSSDVYSPTFESKTTEDESIVITLKGCPSGLMVSDAQSIRDFEICGEDKIYRKANAQIISNNQVRVWSQEVASPVNVRYAFRNSPDVNLYGNNGLPVAPFRTDDYNPMYLPRLYHKTLYTPDENVIVTVDTSKITDTITKVDLYLDGDKKATLTQAPYEYDFGMVEHGQYDVNAVVTTADSSEYLSFGTSFACDDALDTLTLYENDYDDYTMVKNPPFDFTGAASTNTAYELVNTDNGGKCFKSGARNNETTSVYNYIDPGVDVLSTQFNFMVEGNGTFTMLVPSGRERISAGDGLFSIVNGSLSVVGSGQSIDVAKGVWHHLKAVLYSQTGAFVLTLDQDTTIEGKSSALGETTRLKSVITDVLNSGSYIYIDNFSLTSILKSDTGEIPAEPSVTADDVANTIVGFNPDIMEYAISIDGDQSYGSYTSDAEPALGGNKIVKVRVKAQGANPHSSDVILTFTPNFGDADGNGVINISDVIIVAEIAVGYPNYTTEQRTRANVSDKVDITIDISDVVLIIERVAGGAMPFPIDLP